MKLKGNFLYYDTINANDRIYTKECAEDIVEQFGELIHKNGEVYGQIGYPDADHFGISSEISHKVEEIHINPETHAIEGTIEVLDTPNGEKLLDLIHNDISNFDKYYVIRSRGIGQINENKEVTDYKIISFDVVPKDTDAFIDVHKPLKLE